MRTDKVFICFSNFYLTFFIFHSILNPFKHYYKQQIMSLIQLWLYRDLPESFMLTYGAYIRKRKRLHNGWQLVTLVNGFAFLLHDKYDRISCPTLKKVAESCDGKFMIVNKNGKKLVYTADGKPLSTLDTQSMLYPNGWYRCPENGALSLYDAKGICIGSNLRAAKVFPNGMYHMSVNEAKDGLKAGVFAADGTKLLFTNSVRVSVLPSGWFIDDYSLYDNLGRVFIEPLPMRRVPHWMLYLVGRMMKSRKS